MVTPDAGDARAQGVAQGAGEGRRPQEGVVQGQEAQVGAGHLQGRTRDQFTLRHRRQAPTTWGEQISMKRGTIMCVLPSSRHSMSLSPLRTEPVGQSRWTNVPICELVVFFLT